jgi:predicted DNA-binding transcriptional regulator AlpA
MQMPRKSKASARPLVVGQIYRRSEGPAYFGLQSSQIDEKIKSGEIPPPFPLTDTGRASGWLGQTILAWQAARIAAAGEAPTPPTPEADHAASAHRRQSPRNQSARRA